MNKLAARLDPCVNWFKLLSRTKGRILWVFPALLLVGYLASLRYGDAGAGFLDRFREHSGNASLLAEANRLDLDYEKVLGKPQDYVGKPVSWCVDTPNAGTAYVSGRPSWPVDLDGGYEFSSVGHCRQMLAVVTGFEKGRIQLRLVERL